VELGFESGGRSEIRSGLAEGDKVVVSGQFLIDSEASLRATGTRMEGAARIYRAHGEIESVGSGGLVIRHGDVPSAGMGAMTMPFLASREVVPPGLAPGDRVRFEFTAEPGGQYRITTIAPADASLPEHGAHK
jgi:Cu(I)/Ag(I) efflux system membrane fusion protein